MSLTPGRKHSAGQRRRSVQGTSSASGGRYSHNDASNTNTYPLSGRGIEGSPTARTYPGTPRRQVKHATCGDNHGIRPPPPEQYLTPLQQKEVCIRHLRARLRENVDRLQTRDCEIGELRNQLCRMQEDWIEEECHRVEAQLALKEAHREIQHLHEVVESARTNLSPQPDLQDHSKPYLGPAAAVRPGGRSRSCGCSPASTLSRSTTYTRLSSEALALQLDSNGNLPQGAPPRTEARTHLLLEAALLSEPAPSPGGPPRVGPGPPSVPRSYTYERLCSGGAVLPVSHSCHSLSSGCRCSGHAYLPHHHLFLHLPQEEAPPLAPAPATAPVSAPESKPEVRSQACSPTITWLSTEGGGADELSVISLATADVITPSEPLQPSPPPLTSSPPPRPPPPRLAHSVKPLPPHGAVETAAAATTVAQTRQPSPGSTERQAATVVEVEEDEAGGGAAVEEESAPQRSHWSRYFLVDLLALAVPVVPTVAWLCRGAPRDVLPGYHIGSLLRGCCAVALHSLRRRGAVRSRGPAGTHGTTSI